MRTRYLVLLVVVLLLMPIYCERKGTRRQDSVSAADTVSAAPAGPIFPTGAGGRPITFTIDSLPAEALAALRARYPQFVAYQPDDYPESARLSYAPSPGDGMSVVRADLGGGAMAYAIAGRRGETQEVIGIVKDAREPIGWLARSMSAGGTPPFYPWITISRRRRAHPNGRLDAVVVKILDRKGAYDDIYWWNPGDRQFHQGGGQH